MVITGFAPAQKAVATDWLCASTGNDPPLLGRAGTGAPVSVVVITVVTLLVARARAIAAAKDDASTGWRTVVAGFNLTGRAATVSAGRVVVITLLAEFPQVVAANGQSDAAIGRWTLPSSLDGARRTASVAVHHVGVVAAFTVLPHTIAATGARNGETKAARGAIVDAGGIANFLPLHNGVTATDRGIAYTGLAHAMHERFHEANRRATVSAHMIVVVACFRAANQAVAANGLQSR